MDKLEKIKTQVQDLTNALERLAEAVVLEGQEIYRDGTIQRFEFSFEIVWKLLKSVNEHLGKDCFNPRDCIRLAYQNGLLNNPKIWFEYLEARNLASHTYNKAQAEEVYQKAKEFLPEARKVLEAVRTKLEL